MTEPLPQQTEPEIESGHDVDELGRDCREARHAIARFVGGSVDRATDRRFRNHLMRCQECRAIYRETMSTAARMGGALRSEREETERETRHVSFRARAIQATADKRRRNRFGLRLALLPAGIALLILLFRAGGGESALVLHWNGGHVRAAGQLLNDDRPRMRLSSGDWCETRGNATARIATSIELGEEPPPFTLGIETSLQVLDAKDHNVRLARGSLSARGPCSVITPHGVLAIESGGASVVLDGARYVLSVESGEVSWTGPSETRTLSAGQRLGN